MFSDVAYFLMYCIILYSGFIGQAIADNSPSYNWSLQAFSQDYDQVSYNT